MAERLDVWLDRYYMLSIWCLALAGAFLENVGVDSYLVMIIPTLLIGNILGLLLSGFVMSTHRDMRHTGIFFVLVLALLVGFLNFFGPLVPFTLGITIGSVGGLLSGILIRSGYRPRLLMV